jgi:acetyl-CoA acyltransferase 1
MQHVQHRIQQIYDHLSPSPLSSSQHSLCPQLAYSAKLNEKSDDDIVIVSCVRTAIGKAKRGAFKDTHWTDLLAAVLKGVLERPGVAGKVLPKDVQDIHVGIVLAPGGGATQARQAMFLAGYPYETAITTVNRQCSSGLQAVANVAAAIAQRYFTIGIGAGVESMSAHDMVRAVGDVNERIFDNPLARDCLLTMGQTSENVAEKFGVTRDKQDRFALESYRKALAAQRADKFKEEIIPVTTTVVKDDGQKHTITVVQDEGPRPTTLEALAKLKPAFTPTGSSTAGNSSQTSDGAAAVLLMTRAEAKARGLPILGRWLSYHVAGVPPNVMGIGPAYAIPPAIAKAALTQEQIDVFEINEAFASQAVYCVEKLNIPMHKVNPLGGAIALGHPLGCTGARQVCTLLYQLRREKLRYGVISMCIGTGMGAAAVVEAEW